MEKHDRRHAPRLGKVAPIQVLLTRDFYRDLKENCEQIPARLVNQSEDGLYIELDRVLTAGTSVSIMMESPKGYQPGETYYMKEGLVLRCVKVDNATSRFGAGIKILRKVVCAPILSNRFR